MTRYEQGFLTKCAEYGVDVDTAVDFMQKQAGLVSPLTRLMVKLHPQVNPAKLGFLGRKLLTTTSRRPMTITESRQLPKLVEGALDQAYGHGAYGHGALDTMFDSSARGLRTVTRLSPKKILALLGLAGGGTALATSGRDSSSDSPSVAQVGGGKSISPKSISPLLSAAILATGAGAAGAVALSRKKRKSKKQEEEDSK